MRIKAQFFSLRLGPTDPAVLRGLIRRAADSGLNMVCLEVEKAMRYRSHPEIAAPWAMPRETLEEVTAFGRGLGLEMVPLLPSFSHMEYLFDAYPELCESSHGSNYCPSNPASHALMCDLLTELIEVFQPSRFVHIGHDEAVSSYDARDRVSIFNCPRCRRLPPYRLYAEDILRLHGFLKARGLRTMMWADCLLTPPQFKDVCFAQSCVYGGAPDHLERGLPLLPRDIVMCDWHYELAREFPTVRYLQEQGFDTLGCPAYPINSFLFTRYAWAHRTPRFLGMMPTAWKYVNKDNARLLRSFVRRNGFYLNHPAQLPPGAAYERRAVEACRSADAPLPRGRFRKIYLFGPGECGAYHSRGWRDLSHVEYPDSTDRLIGPARPAELRLKPRRHGEIEYEFQARPGCVLETLDLRVWLSTPGRHAVQARSAGSSAWRTVARDVSLRGTTLPLTAIVGGRAAFRLRFTADNTGDKKAVYLKRFELRGRTVAEGAKVSG